MLKFRFNEFPCGVGMTISKLIICTMQIENRALGFNTYFLHRHLDKQICI